MQKVNTRYLVHNIVRIIQLLITLIIIITIVIVAIMMIITIMWKPGSEKSTHERCQSTLPT